MCETCFTKSALISPSSASENAPVIRPVQQNRIQENAVYRNRRPKLWELELDLHCSIIGTCVPLGTLRKIYAKVNKGESKHLSDYQIHNLFVSSADRPQVGIKMVHKYLEKAYAPSIAKSRELETEAELAQFWDECVKKGEIAAGYWAVMTHQQITTQLGNVVFGAVHMFSHLAGRQLQAETVKGKSSRQEVGALKNTIASKEKVISVLQKKMASRDIEHEELLLQVSNQQLCNERYVDQIEKLSSSSELIAADKRIRVLEKELYAAKTQQQSKKVTLERKYEHTIQYLQDSLDASVEQVTFLEKRLETLAIADQAINPDDNPTKDLCGRCVLYVGGQTGYQSNFRELVETRNGQFLYHDGGREDSRQRLKTLLGKADAVICPVSCVSHSATCNIKKICSRKEKKMIWIKSPSLAAFNSALLEVN